MNEQAHVEFEETMPGVRESKADLSPGRYVGMHLGENRLILVELMLVGDEHSLVWRYGGESTCRPEYREFEMSHEDHEQLLETLSEIEGTFQLSGYHSSLYDEASERYGWRCVETKIDNKASGKKTKPKKVECLWMNYS